MMMMMMMMMMIDVLYFMATFEHMVGKMDRLNSKRNEAKTKMKHP